MVQPEKPRSMFIDQTLDKLTGQTFEDIENQIDQNLSMHEVIALCAEFDCPVTSLTDRMYRFKIIGDMPHNRN